MLCSYQGDYDAAVRAARPCHGEVTGAMFDSLANLPHINKKNLKQECGLTEDTDRPCPLPPPIPSSGANAAFAAGQRVAKNVRYQPGRLHGQSSFKREHHVGSHPGRGVHTEGVSTLLGVQVRQHISSTFEDCRVIDSYCTCEAAVSCMR